MKKFAMYCLMSFMSLNAWAAEDITGFWKTIDDTTKKPQSLIAIYPYEGKRYGRIIATYDENGVLKDSMNHKTENAPGVVGNPPYVGLDIIWDLKDTGKKFTDGHILDPEKGRVYDSEAWRKGDKLVVRGQIFFIGKNQEWLQATEADFPPGEPKPEVSKLTPSIPKVKK